MAEPVIIKECDCPCHEGKCAPHDEFVCTQCGKWLKNAPSRLDLYRKQARHALVDDDF